MFAIANERKSLWQWDLNQQLTVDGNCTEVHYLDRGASSTLTMEVKDGKADIPNILLQKAGRLVVYAYIVDAQDHHTKICEAFGISARPKPAEYVYTETEVKTWSDLQSQIGDLADLATEEKDNLVAAINEVKASSSSGEASDAVLYTEQSLTEEQKAQARENIGGVRPVITLDYSLIGNGFTWNHTATEIQALRGKKYLFAVNGCHANCNFYAGNMRVSWVDGNELKYSDIDNSGKSGEIFSSDIGGITGQVTADKVTNPDHLTDLVQYGAFEAAVPLVQSMGITGAQVGQTIKVKAVNAQGMPTAWEAADMVSDEMFKLTQVAQYNVTDITDFPAYISLPFQTYNDFFLQVDGLRADAATTLTFVLYPDWDYLAYHACKMAVPAYIHNVYGACAIMRLQKYTMSGHSFDSAEKGIDRLYVSTVINNTGLGMSTTNRYSGFTAIPMSSGKYPYRLRIEKSGDGTIGGGTITLYGRRLA